MLSVIILDVVVLLTRCQRIYFMVSPSFIQHHLKCHVSLCWVSLSILDVVVPLIKCLHVYFLGSAQALLTIIWNAMCLMLSVIILDVVVLLTRCQRIYFRACPSLVSIIWNAMCHYAECHYSRCCGAPDKTSVRIFTRVNPRLIQNHLKCHVLLCWVSLS